MLRIWNVDFVVLILNAGAPLKNEIALRSSQYFCRTQLQSILFLDSIKLIPLGDAVGYINRSPLQDLQLSWVNSRRANMQKRPDKERYFLIAINLLVTLPTSIYYTQRSDKNWFILADSLCSSECMHLPWFWLVANGWCKESERKESQQDTFLFCISDCWDSFHFFGSDRFLLWPFLFWLFPLPVANNSKNHDSVSYLFYVLGRAESELPTSQYFFSRWFPPPP